MISQAQRRCVATMKVRGQSLLWLWAVLVMLGASCQSTGDGGPPVTICPPADRQMLRCESGPAAEALPPSCADCAELAEPALSAALAGVKDLTPSAFAARYPSVHSTALGYDPSTAANLKRIDSTALALSSDELAILSRNGFVISKQRRFPNFMYGYETLYGMDLPLFVSADSIMNAVHRSYDAMLANLESAYLAKELSALLLAMQQALAGSADAGFSAEVVGDVDIYVAVARSLLADSFVRPIDPRWSAEVQTLYNSARAAMAPGSVTLFGASQLVDFSQFAPRGHYEQTPALQSYFRCVMWLGRIELRLVTADQSGTPQFQRRALNGAFLLATLKDQVAKQGYQNVDSVIRFFVGEPDDMTPDQLMALLSTMSLRTPAEIAARTDAEFLSALAQFKGGVSRIAGQILEGGLYATATLPRSFLFLGQRYTPDAHVLSNVVYDRVLGKPEKRLMASPLDVAFAALHNNQAGALLAPELARYGYASELAAMRVLLDAHGDSYWQGNLYGSWLGVLRTLSPDASTQSPTTYGLPSVAGTEAWGKRLLNTQLASWAELRHDTILYAKSSYGSSTTCDFPDVYVDPYPRFYQALADLGMRGANMANSLPATTPLLVEVAAYFEHLTQVAYMLGEMAEYQRARRPLEPAHLAFINELVRISQGCGMAQAPGWFTKLHWSPSAANLALPIIADVFTQPTDEGGTPVGRVLHVATGRPRLMVMTADTCQGPRAYFGLASSYYEHTTDGFMRLNDSTWNEMIMSMPPSDVPWLSDVLPK